MTTEQLNNILNTKSYNYKFINRNSTDKIIISINGLGLNQLSKSIINRDEFKTQGGSIFDVFENPNLLEDPSIKDRKSLFDFYNVFTTHSSCSDADILFLSDTSWNHYLKGIKGLASNTDEIKDFLYALITNKGYKSIYFVGTCSGAWMVALQALSIQITENQVSFVKALLFNPLNDLSKSNHFKKITNTHLNESTLDLVNISNFQNNNNIDISEISTFVHFVIYYSKFSGKNEEQSDMYNSLKNEKVNVELHPIETPDSNLARFLKDTGQLSTVLTSFFNIY
jgi:hypothetical protein